MKILFLCNKQTYLTKMSRVRFHGIEALSKISEVTYWGLNWPNYNSNLNVQENLDKLETKFDICIAYKPLELKNFKYITPVKCIRYNEMWDINWTLKEIKESGAQLVICHHLNDCQQYKKMNIPDVKFVYVGHCAKKSIFKNYNINKEYDILLAGCLGSHYPLRCRFYNLLEKLKKKYKCYIHPHPGYNLNDSYTDKYLKEMAITINKSRIVLTDTGKPRSRYGKYIEIPMCESAAICGDLPDDNADDYSFVIEVNMKMNDDEIIEKISYYLDNENERLKKVELGKEFSSNYTQEHYAERLLEQINGFIL